MSRSRVLAAAAALMTASSLGVASPAWAAAPSNDRSAGATAASVGFNEVLDTTEATTDAEDAQFNESCSFGFQHTDASVWYTIEGDGRAFMVSAGSGGYIPGTLVGVGSPGSLQTVACGLFGSSWIAEAGTTYYVLVIDPKFDSTGNGGTTDVSFRAEPAPTIELTVNRQGFASKGTGMAHLTGSYTCTNAADLGVIQGTLTQTIKQRVPVTAVGLIENIFPQDCNGIRQTWKADVEPRPSYSFRPGVADVYANVVVCGEFSCVTDEVSQKVTLSPVQ
jgi:hypothetical protein